MFKHLFLFILTFTTFTAEGQDYSNYYKHCNAADSLEYIGLNQQALDAFKTAFKSVDYVHSDKYRDAYHLAIKTGAFEDAFQFGKMSIINSGNKKFIDTKSSSFKRSKYYSWLKDSTDCYLQKYNNRVNHDYIKMIDSLHFIDQRIIRKNWRVRGKYNIDKSALPENRFELDSVNWQLLHSLIDSLGFPSEQNVGRDAYYDAIIIIHHNLRQKENEIYHEEIFHSIKKGEYSPLNFSYWYEQFQNNVYGISYFYTWNSVASEENLKRIDMNRRRFYLKTSNSYEITSKGRKWRSKW